MIGDVMMANVLDAAAIYSAGFGRHCKQPIAERHTRQARASRFQSRHHDLVVGGSIDADRAPLHALIDEAQFAIDRRGSCNLENNAPARDGRTFDQREMR
jgi:hypothetical protein